MVCMSPLFTSIYTLKKCKHPKVQRSRLGFCIGRQALVCKCCITSNLNNNRTKITLASHHTNWNAGLFLLCSSQTKLIANIDTKEIMSQTVNRFLMRFSALSFSSQPRRSRLVVERSRSLNCVLDLFRLRTRFIDTQGARNALLRWMECGRPYEYIRSEFLSG